MDEINNFHKTRGSDLSRELNGTLSHDDATTPAFVISQGFHNRNKTATEFSSKMQSENN